MNTKTHYERTLETAASIVTRCYKYRCKEQWETASRWFDLAVRYYPKDAALQWEQESFSSQYRRRGE